MGYCAFSEQQWRRVLDGLQALTAKEQEVLRHFVRGESAGTIAALLSVSERTVETHAAHIRQKLQVRSILIAAVYVTAIEVDRQPVPPYELTRPKRVSSGADA